MLMEVWGAALIALAMACQLRTPYDTTDAARVRVRVLYWLCTILPATSGLIVAWVANVASARTGMAAPYAAWIFPSVMGFAAGIGAVAALASSRLIPTVIASTSASIACTIVIAMMREGWLRWLGVDASLGHGAIDLSAMAILALSISGVVAGRFAHHAMHIPALPIWLREGAPRSIAGAALMLAGFVLINANSAEVAPALPAAQLLGATLTCAVALAAGLTYGWFVTGRFDARFGVQAVLAGSIGASSIAVIPTHFAPVIGVLCALCALPVAHWIRERMPLRDPRGALGGLALPAIISLLTTGLLADGRHLPGWNNVGVGTYLNTLGLGVVGWAAAGDVGQFSAQIVLVATTFALAATGAAAAFSAANRIDPARMVERSTSTAIEMPDPLSAAPGTPANMSGQDEIDGESLNTPRKTLPQTRAYRVAYPFRNRAAKKQSTRFVVQDDDGESNRS
jgi:hypothetical protein